MSEWWTRLRAHHDTEVCPRNLTDLQTVQGSAWFHFRLPFLRFGFALLAELRRSVIAIGNPFQN